MRCLHATDHGGGCAGVRQSVRREQETFSFRLPLNEHMSCKKCDLYRWDGCEVRLSDPCPRVSRVCPGSPWCLFTEEPTSALRARAQSTHMRWPTPSSIAAAAASAIVFSTASHYPTLAVEPPSTEALATLRKAYQAATDGLLPNADNLLTKSVAEWKRTAQPADEIAALYKVRGTVRQEQGRTMDAVGDLDEALALLTSPSSAKPAPSELQRTYLLRARLNAALERWKEAEADFSAAIARLDELDAIEATNPYLYSERSSVRSHLGDWAGAADDALTASIEFKDIGDKLRSLLASSDASLALYGAGDIDEALSRMRSTFTSFSQSDI